MILENILAKQLKEDLINSINKSDLSLTLKRYILMDLINEITGVLDDAIKLEMSELEKALKEGEASDDPVL